jgi:hypothetical protein
MPTKFELGDVFSDEISLSPKSKQYKRTVFNFLNVCRNVGGVMTVFLTISEIIMNSHTDLIFKIEAIKKFFIPIDSEKLKEPDFFGALKLITNICPDK